jgi:1-acyl-sn-glycerol-3-phosphate acyltransferase
MFYEVVRALFYLPIKLFYPTKIIGKEHLLREKSILICNHKSNLDGIIIGVNLKQKISFLGKSELFKNKLSRWFFTKMKVIEVHRGSADLKAIKQALTVLKNGGILGIFPAGTRTSEQDEEEFKNGVSMFSVKAKAPIIPMMFVKKPKLFRKNTLIIGKPFDLTLEENEKLTKEVLNKLTSIVQIKQNELSLLNKGEK